MYFTPKKDVIFWVKSDSRIPTEDLAKLAQLAYETVKAMKVDPKEILIRSELHNTTRTRAGRIEIDSDGYHVTLSVKDAKGLIQACHKSAHGYVVDPRDYEFKYATDTGVKSDSVPGRGNIKHFNWPDASRLKRYQFN